MAVATAPQKHSDHTQPLLAAVGEVFHFLPHHTRSFRKRHILLLLVSLSFVGVMFLELAVIINRQSLDPRALFPGAATAVSEQSTTQVSSSNGFSFTFNNQQFSATARTEGASSNGAVSDAELNKNSPLGSVTLTPLPSYVPVAEAAAELEVRVETDRAAFAVHKSNIEGRVDINAIIADYFAPQSTSSATIQEELRTTEQIGGVLMTKSVYVVSPTFAGNPTRTTIWSAEVNSKPTALYIRGIIDGANIPSTMVPVVDSLRFTADTQVQGLSVFSGTKPPLDLDQKYIADLVSPSVVKVYHIVCGSLQYKSSQLSSDTCRGTTGSGFIVSSDGYVATNGHVVVYGAKDILVNALLSDKTLLAQFLAGSQLTSTQIDDVLSRPDLTASVVSKIYDLPDSEIQLIQKRELTVVATGTKPFELTDQSKIKQVIDQFSPTESLKSATVVGFDYAAKDQLTVVADPKKGFSSSDVALLKIDVSNAPLIELYSSHITQNQSVTLFGFPGDADNQLTDNSSLGVSVTNGTISAIRESAGTRSKLYQSDADASHGNSGGPAVDRDGRAFGILTYRYSSGNQADATKSYIRDIADFTELVSANNVELNTTSSTQDAWEQGLTAYSNQYYSKALEQFNYVQKQFPAHRLVATYIDYSEQAIREGKDVREPSAALFVLGVGAGLGGLLVAILLTTRHYGHHRAYYEHTKHKLRPHHG